MNIEYTNNLDGITESMLDGGFFVNWPNPPREATHLKILRASYCSYVAIDTDSAKVVGFINAISDGVLAAYIPLLEVLPEYQGKGIGSELTKLILDDLKSLYMIDICHDADIAPFYAKLGAHSGYSSIFRNYAAQSGKS